MFISTAFLCHIVALLLLIGFDVNALFIMATTSPFNITEMVQTTVAPNYRDSAVIGVVILLVLCTLAGLVYMLYRYLCHNKGIYRTTGEAVLVVDPDQVYHNTVTENKEYFI